MFNNQYMWSKLAGNARLPLAHAEIFPMDFPTLPYALIFSITGIAVEVLMVANDRGTECCCCCWIVVNLWIVVAGCESLWLVLGRRGSLWGCSGSLWGCSGSLWVIVGSLWGRSGLLWGHSGLLWGRSGSLWVVVGSLWIIVGHCGVVVGSLWVVPCFSNYDRTCDLWNTSPMLWFNNISDTVHACTYQYITLIYFLFFQFERSQMKQLPWFEQLLQTLTLNFNCNAKWEYFVIWKFFVNVDTWWQNVCDENVFYSKSSCSTYPRNCVVVHTFLHVCLFLNGSISYAFHWGICHNTFMHVHCFFCMCYRLRFWLWKDNHNWIGYSINKIKHATFNIYAIQYW